MKIELRQQFQIESARFLPKLPAAHPCSRMHGHSFKIIISLIGDVDPEMGWVMDYHEISNIMKPILSKLDHHILNEIEGLKNPTSELLAKWIYDQAISSLPILKSVSVLETDTTECRYSPNIK